MNYRTGFETSKLEIINSFLKFQLTQRDLLYFGSFLFFSRSRTQPLRKLVGVFTNAVRWLGSDLAEMTFGNNFKNCQIPQHAFAGYRVMFQLTLTKFV